MGNICKKDGYKPIQNVCIFLTNLSNITPVVSILVISWNAWISWFDSSHADIYILKCLWINKVYVLLRFLFILKSPFPGLNDINKMFSIYVSFLLHYYLLLYLWKLNSNLN